MQRIVGKVNYSMLTEKELRRLVRELGLPDRGDRRALIHLHRHLSWMWDMTIC